MAICRSGSPLVPEDALEPRFVAFEEIRQGRLRGVYLSESRPWWVEVSAGQNRQLQYQLWEMLLYWVGKAAPVLEKRFASLPAGPIRWSAEFDFRHEPDLLSRPKLTLREVDQSREVTKESPNSVTAKFGPEFQSTLHQPDNFAEREIIAAFTEATSLLANDPVNSNEARELANLIAPDPTARLAHMFEARSFVQFVRSDIPTKHVPVTRQDDANLRLGLGWRVRSRTDGSLIQGKADCMAYLNSLVSSLQDELAESLRKFGRKSLITRALKNYQAVSVERLQWMSTAPAVVSLWKDRATAMAKIGESESERNAVSLASRIIIEAALSESPEDGPAEIGSLDLSHLMTVALGIFKYGGWSDAIRWDAMKPIIRISPLGDVLASTDFEDGVVLPFQKKMTAGTVEEAIANYDDRYKPLEQPKSIDRTFEAEYLTALKAEWGFTLDDAFQILDALDSAAIERDASILIATKEELLSILRANEVRTDKVDSFLAEFTMVPRTTWRTVPNGFTYRDISPWRFRRRLSLLKLPILNISGREDGELLIAPDVIREALNYQARNFHQGDFDRSYAKSQEMARWIGGVNNREGHAFNVEVRDRLRELGWTAEADVKITRLLKKGFGRKDYGDVDVLAWRASDNRVLLLECKDLQFKKTFGEIAEQVSRFRGEVGADGKPDLLRKHLDRLQVCKDHHPAIGAFTGISAPAIEAHIIFRNTVPMRYAWEHLESKVGLHLFRDLDRL